MKKIKIELKEFASALFEGIKLRKLVIIEKVELINRIQDKHLKKWLKKSEGIETCFHGYFNESEIIVCTSWSDLLNDFKVHDSCWVVLITPHAAEPYFSDEIRRDKKGTFVQKTMNWLDFMIELATRWPTLPKTNVKMRLVRGKEMHQRIFIPPNDGQHYPKKFPFIFNLVEADLSEKNALFILTNLKNRIQRRKRTEAAALENNKPLPEYRRVMRTDSKKEPTTKKGFRYEDIYNDGAHLD